MAAWWVNSYRSSSPNRLPPAPSEQSSNRSRHPARPPSRTTCAPPLVSRAERSSSSSAGSASAWCLCETFQPVLLTSARRVLQTSLPHGKKRRYHHIGRGGDPPVGHAHMPTSSTKDQRRRALRERLFSVRSSPISISYLRNGKR